MLIKSLSSTTRTNCAQQIRQNLNALIRLLPSERGGCVAIERGGVALRRNPWQTYQHGANCQLA